MQPIPQKQMLKFLVQVKDSPLPFLDFFSHHLKKSFLNSGTLTCLMIVTPLILLAYAVEGRKRIQATSLDPLFSFVGAALLIASGGMF